MKSENNNRLKFIYSRQLVILNKNRSNFNSLKLVNFKVIPVLNTYTFYIAHNFVCTTLKRTFTRTRKSWVISKSFSDIPILSFKK